MSQQNVEIVWRVFDAVNRRDIETMEALIPEEGEFHSVFAASEGRVFQGHQGIREYFEWFDDAFDEFRTEVEKVIDAGDARVVALAKLTARGRESGVVLDQRTGVVFTFLSGQIARMDGYFDHTEALEAARLSE